MPDGARGKGPSLGRVVLDRWVGLELAWAVSGAVQIHPYTPRRIEGGGDKQSHARAWLCVA